MSNVHTSRTRDLLELILGYGVVVGVIWTPEQSPLPMLDSTRLLARAALRKAVED